MLAESSASGDPKRRTTIEKVKVLPFYAIIIGRWPYDSIISPLAIRSLRSSYEKKKPKTIPELVDFCMKFDYVGVNCRPFQVRSEIIRLLEIVKAKKPKVILEIGTAKGGTLFLFSKIAPEGARILSLDLPGLAGESFFRRWRASFFRSFGEQKTKIILYWLDSHSRRSFGKIKRALGGEALDVLFIDGDHSYEGAKRDFEMYSGLVKHGGIVAMHDIVKHPPEAKCDVDIFFHELEKKYKTERIVEDENQGWGGIGIVRMP